MPREKRFVSAVVLAAGMSSRLGRPKQLVSLGSRPLLEGVLDAIRGSKVRGVVVVLGHESDEVARRVRLRPAERVVVNPDYSRGLSTSVKAGIRAVSPGASAVLLVLADQPFLSTALVDRIVDAYLASAARVVAPTRRGLQGNPVLVDRSLFPEVLGVEGDVGAKPVIARHRDETVFIEVEEQDALLDVDTEEDLRRARSILRRAHPRKRPSA